MAATGRRTITCSRVTNLDTLERHELEALVNHNLLAADDYHSLPLLFAASDAWFRVNPTLTLYDLEMFFRGANCFTTLKAREHVVSDFHIVPCSSTLEQSTPFPYHIQYTCNAERKDMTFTTSLEQRKNLQKLKITGKLAVNTVQSALQTPTFKPSTPSTSTLFQLVAGIKVKLHY